MVVVLLQSYQPTFMKEVLYLKLVDVSNVFSFLSSIVDNYVNLFRHNSATRLIHF